jgi:hypothetical protein
LILSCASAADAPQAIASASRNLVMSDLPS